METIPESEINPSAPPTFRETGHKSRHVAKLSNVPFFGRSAWMSRIQQIASQAPRSSRHPQLLAFLKVWNWIGPYLRDLCHENAPYQTYPKGESGIFEIAAPDGGPMRIAVAADWGTGTLESEVISKHMLAGVPHYTMHLGDVYYMGEAGEIAENCLGVVTGGYRGVHWPTQHCLGSFALMGNHEMYSGGQGYFEHLVSTLGLFDAERKVRSPQRASYFCLEAEHWVILGLDTGYHSGGVPAFTNLPILNAIPAFNVDARFDEKMMVWLEQTIAELEAKGSGKKSILVMTHHQPISSFEHAFDTPARQLARTGFLNGRQFVWLYGHEHRMTVYKEQTIVDSLQAYPRCIGHGGMPVELTTVSTPDSKILFYDPRQHPIDKDDPETMVGYNGHVMLQFEGAQLTIEYRDILKNAVLLTETFTPTGNGGLEQVFSKPPGSPLFTGDQTNYRG